MWGNATLMLSNGTLNIATEGHKHHVHYFTGLFPLTVSVASDAPRPREMLLSSLMARREQLSPIITLV
jgi:hypothetical protein